MRKNSLSTFHEREKRNYKKNILRDDRILNPHIVVTSKGKEESRILMMKFNYKFSTSTNSYAYRFILYWMLDHLIGL